MRLVLLIYLTIMTNTQAKSEEAVFGGGCFWCTEAIFQEIKGVQSVQPGYSGGTIINPSYREVCTGRTGHAEVIRIEFDPKEIAYEKLLEVFFLTHDPTSLNRQGADVGTQYRSAVFYSTPQQQQTALHLIEKLNEQKVYPQAIVTTVEALSNFYPAENYHNDYYEKNKNEAYCRFVIQPKMEKFKAAFEDLLKEDK
ncbi:peptide-methionine (S)-S-oxide reductase MsrA [Roseimarinus sediminis]|uniref:peptide-methionine (S)-S-oxide reductase MsrA n=1 Tax=Roseimarinus sediminis TaxID=1610899 RepID=UPI003D20568B